MRIIVEMIKHAEHRAAAGNTVGDYFLDDNNDIQIRISECPDWRVEAAVLVHELVELILVRRQDIALSDIDAWDKSYVGDDEPGNHPRAPYHKPHVFAEIIERMIVRELGMEWQYHEDMLAKIEDGNGN